MTIYKRGKTCKPTTLLTCGTEDGSFSYISAIDSAYTLLAPERKVSEARVENNARIVVANDVATGGAVIRRDAARRRTSVAIVSDHSGKWRGGKIVNAAPLFYLQ